MTVFFASCSKDDVVESKSNEIKQTAYFEGVGDVTATLVENEDGSYKISEDFDSKILDDFFNGVTEPHAYFNEDGKIHIFKTEESRKRYVLSNSTKSLRCSENTSGNLKVQFYKHKNHSSEYTGLRKTLYSTGNFSFYNVNSYHSGSNDNISSVKITDSRHKDDYALILYKHSNYGGESAWISLKKCYSQGGVSNMKNSWIWFNAWINNWVPQSSFNDTTSSIRGFYFY